jgi:hypothetical protein
MLPALVAIFDDMVVAYDDPTTLHRYAIVRVQPTNDALILSAYPPPTGPATLLEGPIEMYPGRFSLILYPKTSRWDSRIWRTGEILRIGEQDIPIVDFEYRSLFRTWPYQLKIEGDTVGDCRKRQSAQGSRRVNILTAPFRNPIPLPLRKIETVLQIPNFVAGLIKEKAVSSDDVCPISQIPFMKGVPATLLGCFHLFEPASINRWMSVKNECPICKAAIGATMVI